MSDENVTMTRKEFVMAQREAFMRGADWRFMASECAPLPTPKSSGVGRYCEYVEAAKETYPLRVTRPRVVADPHRDTHSQNWRCVDGVIEFNAGAGCNFKPAFDRVGSQRIEKGFCTWPTPERIAMWADLLASPTELVDQD